uniref:PCRF domain-containing protein n=1 Tax=Angiostrongylus cantonensis TaxID=6313 RepID=A0A0K0CZT8_ANGCA
MYRASAAILPHKSGINLSTPEGWKTWSSETCNGSADSQLTVPMLKADRDNALAQLSQMTASSEQRIAELEKELLLVESGQHPMLLEKLREIEQKQADELEMIEIMYETLVMEVDDRIRFIEAEVAALDVAGPACPTFSMNKKCLRRYQKGQALVVQTENYGAFAGMILSICEQYIQFRSTVPGL